MRFPQYLHVMANGLPRLPLLPLISHLLHHHHLAIYFIFAAPWEIVDPQLSRRFLNFFAYRQGCQLSAIPHQLWYSMPYGWTMICRSQRAECASVWLCNWKPCTPSSFGQDFSNDPWERSRDAEMTMTSGDDLVFAAVIHSPRIGSLRCSYSTGTYLLISRYFQLGML